MAIGTIPPWLNVSPDDFVKAADQGAGAGIAAARTSQAAEQHAAELAMQAQRMRQQAAMESARLSQQQQIAQMELEARQEIAKQNSARAHQENLMRNAYQQSQLGLRKAELDRRTALAEQVAKEKALAFAQEAALAKHIAGGGTMAQGLMLYPHGRGVASALNAASTEEELGQPEVTPVTGGKVLRLKGSKHWQFVPDRPGQRVVNKATGSIEEIQPDGSIKILKAAAAPPADPLTTTTQTPTKGLMEKIGDMLTSGGKVFRKPGTETTTEQPKVPFKEGAQVRLKSDPTKVFIVRDGKLVPMEQNPPPSHDETEIVTEEE